MSPWKPRILDPPKPPQGATGAASSSGAEKTEVLRPIDRPFPVAPNGAFSCIELPIPGARAPGYSISPATRACPRRAMFITRTFRNASPGHHGACLRGAMFPGKHRSTRASRMVAKTRRALPLSGFEQSPTEASFEVGGHIGNLNLVRFRPAGWFSGVCKRSQLARRA